jgi:hypothetical protein
MIDPQNKRFVADMVRANYLFNWSFDTQRGRTIVENYAGTISRIEWVRDIPNENNITVVETLGTLFVFAGGIADQVGRERIFEGWNDRERMLDANGFNDYAVRLVRLRVAPMINFSSWDNRQVVYVGQSAGGLVCEALPYYMFGDAQRPQDISILTGTPRGLHFDGKGFYSTGTFWRFMLLNDPVVSLPPRFREWPEVCLLFSAIDLPYTIAKILGAPNAAGGNFVFDLWPGWHHPPGGIILSDDGYSIGSHDLPPPRSSLPIVLPVAQTIHNLFSYTAHEMLSYVGAVERWGILNATLEKPQEQESVGSSGGDFGLSGIEFFCPADDFGNIVFSPNGRVQVANSIIQTGTTPMPDGSLGGVLYLRGQLVAKFATRGRAKTAASRLNRFLARLPFATEVSTSGLADGMLQYLSEAAIGGGVDRRPVKVVT